MRMPARRTPRSELTPGGPRSDRFLEDHRRVLTGDPEARERIAAALLRELRPVVRRTVRQLDSDGVGQAIDEAVMDYLRAPEAFDPTRGPLLGFLATAAVRNGFNLRRGESRRLRTQAEGANWLASQRHSSGVTSDLISTLVSECCMDVSERAFARAWLDDACIDELAALAGVVNAPEAVRKQVVRQWTERLRLRFKRHFGKAEATRRRP